MVFTQIVVFDFATLASPESVQELEQKLSAVTSGKQISILVNNVGFCKMAKMSEATIQDTMRMINVNVNSQAYMTRFVLPLMLKRNSRSAIIDISSVCALGGSTTLPIYAATKGFNLLLS